MILNACGKFQICCPDLIVGTYSLELTNLLSTKTLIIDIEIEDSADICNGCAFFKLSDPDVCIRAGVYSGIMFFEGKEIKQFNVDIY